MDVDPLIDVHWFGLRKGGSGRCRVWGFFTPKGIITDRFPLVVRDGYLGGAPNIRVCVFWGDVGKTFHIREVEYDYAFRNEISTKKKNFKEYDYRRILPGWLQFKEEMESYVLLRKLKGEIIEN